MRLGIETPDQLDAALDAITAVSSRGYLVEAQIEEGIELLVGGVRDAVWGPVIAFGRGGHGVEAHKPATRLAPLSDRELAELVADVDPTVDFEVVTPVIRAVEALLLAHPEVTEIDVNPVRLTPRGAIALDALVVCEGRQER